MFYEVGIINHIKNIQNLGIFANVPDIFLRWLI